MSRIGDIAALVLAETMDCLAIAGRPVARGQVEPQTGTWDECCDGMVYVALVRTFRSELFPVEDANWTPCRTNPRAIELTVGVVRCVPVIDEDGGVPTETAITSSTMVLADDAEVVADCLGGFGCGGDDIASALAGQVFLQGDGGCVAVETTLLIDLDA